MAISDKTRKILWGRSGNRCALCRRELVSRETRTDDPSVVGDECHIVSDKEGGPRNQSEPMPKDHDKYENLILLCKVHHKLVDDQPLTYTVDRVRAVKSKHEKWVRERLAGDGWNSHKKQEMVHILPQIHTGKELMDLGAGAYAYLLDHEEPVTEEEVNLLSSFLQNVQDWGDIWDCIDSGEHVRVRFTMTQEIKELEESGFLVFATRQKRRVSAVGISEVVPTLVMTVVRKTNPGITPLGTLASTIRS